MTEFEYLQAQLQQIAINATAPLKDPCAKLSHIYAAQEQFDKLTNGLNAVIDRINQLTREVLEMKNGKQ